MSDVGERGPKGDHGQHGDTGDTGSVGDTGVGGERGQQGAMGERGQVGDRGQIGDVGPIGPEGVPGEQGEQGANPAATRSFLFVVAIAIAALAVMGWQFHKTRELARANHAQIQQSTKLLREITDINGRGTLGSCREFEKLKEAIRKVILARSSVPTDQTRREVAMFPRRPCPRKPSSSSR